MLQEFYVTVVKKAKRGLSADEALEWIEQLSVFPCQPITSQLVAIAVELSERFRISYGDAAILAAAMEQDARIVYSEDLNNGQRYGTTRVLNPFVIHH